jgi:hypothetical protein
MDSTSTTTETFTTWRYDVLAVLAAHHVDVPDELPWRDAYELGLTPLEV